MIPFGFALSSLASLLPLLLPMIKQSFMDVVLSPVISAKPNSIPARRLSATLN